jgi:hypothetical protein
METSMSINVDENRPTIYNITARGAQAAPDVPAFQFSVLTCARRLLATKTIFADGKEDPFGRAKHFQFKYCEIGSLDDFAKLVLTWLADEPRRFIIRGQLKPGLSGWQRRLLLPKDGDPATIECPPRRWIVLDIDGARVPAGLGAPDKLAEAGYHIRDHLLPSYFRGVRCIASATASTGRKGLCTARMRLFFELTEAADNDALSAWLEDLNKRIPAIDPSVLRPQQPIYTARPIFYRCDDPVPRWGRIRVLDGYEDTLTVELPRIRKPKKPTPQSYSLTKIVGEYSLALLEATEGDVGLGVHPIETTAKAWAAIRHVFEMLNGCPKPGGGGRHATLTKSAWQLVRLVAEGELSKLLPAKRTSRPREASIIMTTSTTR